MRPDGTGAGKGGGKSVPPGKGGSAVWMRRLFSQGRRVLLFWGAALVLAGHLCLAWYFSLDPLTLARELLHIALGAVGRVAYSEDLDYVEAARKSYLKGVLVGQAEGHWQHFAAENPSFTLLYHATAPLPDVPFVYQTPKQPYLVRLKERYGIEDLAKSGSDEYDAMLRVFRWLGTRWDHGSDPVPGGCDPVDPLSALEGGERGGKYWCEISAKVAVEAASALGWPARLVTASRDGYRWDHAVTEVWSNRFNKWFAVDTDFNVIYESQGVPLSAYEMCHDAPRLQRDGRLSVRQFAQAKPSLKARDLVPFYRYVHIDLRNDWATRKLRPLSPAGGDLSTWWTSRSELGPLLTVKKRIDERERFDWKVNAVRIVPRALTRHGGVWRIQLALSGYSPGYAAFELYVNGRRYESGDGRATLTLKEGANVIQARIVDREGRRGPTHAVFFTLSSKAMQQGKSNERAVRARTVSPAASRSPL